ncbi:hypothetical protein NUW58_g9637 [Xylaria curta]|uniref:Uncharacterized protein n=1 Tax=Xylaria curta TaxID=42375 RepID=A0ACC1MUW8_9PEZI|nr:hypothetical protein NUW58_g9637 [Xylaria curta]
MASSLLPSSKINDNCDSTPFYSILGLYCRSPYGQLLSTEGRFSQLMRRHWSTIFEQLILSNITSTRLSSTVVVETRSFDLASEDFARQVSFSSQHHVALKSREVYRVASRCYVGLLCHRSHQFSDSAFREWIETFLVTHTTLKPPAVPKELKIPVRRDYGKGWQRIIWGSIRARKKTLERRSEELVTRDCESIAEEITFVFESMLRNIAPRDEWDMVGRAHFHRLVVNFVSRNEACQMVLPAFPCKSPNKDKVGGSDPDMAEHIALETLRNFVRAVRKIYKPGATIWIIHDGHLLSSCIGVGDDVISEYETRLAELYRSIANSPEDRDSVKFISLSDLFFPPGAHDGMRKTLDEAWLDDPRILIHPLPHTKLLPEAELARKLVMASCGINRAHLRTLIKEQDAATLRTYRGAFALHAAGSSCDGREEVPVNVAEKENCDGGGSRDDGA